MVSGIWSGLKLLFSAETDHSLQTDRRAALDALSASLAQTHRRFAALASLPKNHEDMVGEDLTTLREVAIDWADPDQKGKVESLVDDLEALQRDAEHDQITDPDAFSTRMNQLAARAHMLVAENRSNAQTADFVFTHLAVQFWLFTEKHTGSDNNTSITPDEVSHNGKMEALRFLTATTLNPTARHPLLSDSYWEISKDL